MNVKELKPLRDVIIVKAIPKEAASASGIVLNTKDDKEKPTEGIVLAAGPHADMVNVDDHVAFTANIIREDKDADGTFLWMTTENVLGVVKKA